MSVNRFDVSTGPYQVGVFIRFGITCENALCRTARDACVIHLHFVKSCADSATTHDELSFAKAKGHDHTKTIQIHTANIACFRWQTKKGICMTCAVAMMCPVTWVVAFARHRTVVWYLRGRVGGLQRVVLVAAHEVSRG